MKQKFNIAIKIIANLGRSICQYSAYLLPVLLLFVQQNAHADIYGYIDDKGVAHFASERVDTRYELFFKGGESFDTVQGVVPKDASKDAAKTGERTESLATLAAKDKANSKIQAYFDVSPSFKAVRHHMRDAAKTYRIDFELLQALIVAESGFDPLAVSPKGAIGLMQLMPDTAKRFGVSADKKYTVEEKLRDPKTNINAGAKYLRMLINMFPGKLDLAIASYNAGEGAVQKYGNKIPPYKETQNYVKTVTQTYMALKPPVVITSLRNAAAVENTPNRVRMQFNGTANGTSNGSTLGGAVGRGNMVAPLAAADSTTRQN
jgi:soluble lytic murein transglycosylase-like protein